MDCSGKNLFVTGAGGFVASHCIIEILNQGFNVIAIDNFVNCAKSNSGKPESLNRVEKLTGKSLIFYEVDMCSKNALREVMSKHPIDCVIHCAAYKCVPESVALPMKYYNNNVTASVFLMEIMMELGIKKIVFSSTCTVYGNPEYLPIDENHPVRLFTNPYGKTKFFIEEIMKDTCKANKDWSCLMLRFFNPVGAHPSGEIGEDPQGTPNNLMPYVSQVAIGRLDKVKIYGGDYETPDGTGIRDYIHIMDVAKGHVAAVKYMVKTDVLGIKMFNLGTNSGVSVLELIKTFEKVSGKKIPYEIVPRRAGDIPTIYATSKLAETELNWKTKYNLTDMCRDMWNWQLKNPNGY